MTRFAIVFSGRCGSNMLTRMLWKHPEIDLSALEAFAPQPGARGSRRVIGDREDGASYARSVIFGAGRPDAKAVGFKLAYGHAATPPHAGVWDLLAREEVRIIHLTRPNVLDYIISLRLAESQNRWEAVDSRGQYEPTPVEVSADRLRATVEWMEAHWQRVRELVPEDRRLELTFDELVADPAREGRSVCRFLGVKRKKTTPRTVRQRTFSQRRAVADYDRLKSDVRRSFPGLSRFFTD